ncbi:hypothetical protein [Streptomyces sp. NPDC006971]|uniref:hypothetical protein n=1 Tax=Streptomyces sp. NPDC006971 TaxID=3154784 RepID=UPI0033FE0F6C
MRKNHVVVPSEALNAGLSLHDLGLYVCVTWLLQEGSGAFHADRLVAELLVGRGGAAVGPTREELRAGIDRLVAAGLLG